MNPHGIRSVESTPIAGSMNRQQSVRSIMTFRTLPEYSEEPKGDERSWKAGEREGMDSVIELPDDAALAEEQRREEEMEAQYHLRMARQAARDAREERRAARASGDAERIRQAREARDRDAEREELERLRLEHERVKKRPRAVSKVDYGNLGLVAGGKIRKTSQDSERPLISDAGAMGEDDGDLGARRNSNMTIDLPPPHYEGLPLNYGQPSPSYQQARRERIGDSLESLDRMRTRSTPSPPPSDTRDLTPTPPLTNTAIPPSGLGLDFTGYGEYPYVPSPLNNGSRSPSPPSASYMPSAVSSAPVSRQTSVTQQARPTAVNPQARPPIVHRQSSIKRVQELMGRKSTHRMSLPMQPEMSLPIPVESETEAFPRLDEEMRTSSFPTASLAAGDNNPNRMDTIARRRRSINDLMGSAGRPVSMEVTRQQFVLHTPPLASPSPPLPSEERERRRSSLVGLLPRLRNDSQVSLSGLGKGDGILPQPEPVAEQPMIVVESATPIVPAGSAGRGRLGWDNGGGTQRARGTGVSGR